MRGEGLTMVDGRYKAVAIWPMKPGINSQFVGYYPLGRISFMLNNS
jgi:hypothetical protein